MTFAALADPTRRELLRRLAHAPCRASALAEGFAISRPAICKHSRLLEKAGFSFGAFPQVGAYLEAIRARPAWEEIPKLPGL